VYLSYREMKYNGQIGQDWFVLYCLNYKKKGIFLEIGSNHYKQINNTYLLEKEYDWTGTMIEYDSHYFNDYILHRPNSHPILSDATEIDYDLEFKTMKYPNQIDYLQIDLEPTIGTTIQTLELINNTIMNEYTFATITFEHDIYSGDHYNTRSRSREIFYQRGYVLLFPDVCNEGNPYEDWWVHPSLVSDSIIKHLQTSKSLDYKDIIKKFI
jgi:hypothetical protein